MNRSKRNTKTKALQNLKTLANHIWRPPPDAMCAATA